MAGAQERRNPMKKLLRNLTVLLAIGAGAALFCEACHDLGGLAARAERTTQ